MKIRYIIGILSCFIMGFSYAQAAIPIDKNQAQPVSVVVKNTPTTQINLNTADAKILSKSIKGIGIKRAEAIVKYREAHDGFKSVNELSQVPGLGKNFVNNHLTEIQQIFTLK